MLFPFIGPGYRCECNRITDFVRLFGISQLFCQVIPNRYWLLMGTSVEQMGEYSAFSDGFMSSLRNWASCVFTYPNIAMLSTCCDMILILSGKEELLINMFVVCKVAKVVLRITCCKFDIFRPFFLCLAGN